MRADEQKETKTVICARCQVPLVPGKVNIKYLGSAFPVELLKCPSCGLVYVSEELANGKMAEVEKSLEDK
jgi:RNase P subunit RPR2